MSLFQICFLVLNLSCFICIAFIQGLQAHDKKEKQKINFLSDKI